MRARCGEQMKPLFCTQYTLTDEIIFYDSINTALYEKFHIYKYINEFYAWEIFGRQAIIQCPVLWAEIISAYNRRT